MTSTSETVAWLREAARGYDDTAAQLDGVAVETLSVAAKINHDAAAVQHREYASGLRSAADTIERLTAALVEAEAVRSFPTNANARTIPTIKLATGTPSSHVLYILQEKKP